MKKFKILSGLWLLLLSPIFLCAQVSVNRIQFPDPYAVCQANEILYQLELVSGQWPTEISLQYSLSSLPTNSTECISGNPSRLYVANISAVNQSNTNDSYPAQYNQSTASITIDLTGVNSGVNVLELAFDLFIDCSIVPSNTTQSEMELIQLNETINGDATQIAVFTGDVGSVFFSGLQALNSPITLDAFGNTTANFQVTPTLTVSLGSITVEVKFRLYNENNGLSDDCVDSENAELTYEMAGVTQIIPENQWVAITINSGQPIVFSKSYQVDCTDGCGDLRAEFEWRCPEIIEIEDYQCTICQNTRIASFSLIDDRVRSLTFTRDCPINLNDLSCPADSTIWVYRLVNTGEVELKNIEFTLSKLAPANGPNVLVLIDSASVNVSCGPGNGILCSQSNDEIENILDQTPCSYTVMEEIEHINPNIYFQARKNLHRYTIRVDELASGNTIIFKFITERSAEISLADEVAIFAYPGLHYNKYSMSHRAEDGCGNIVANSTGYLSGQATFGDVLPNANLVLNFEPLVTDLAVPPGSDVGADGQSTTLDVRLRGIYHGQGVNSLMYRHYHGVNNANLLGMLRVDVLCDPGLRITETDLTQVTMFSDDGALLQWPVAGISYNPIQEGTCEATAYSFYFNLEDLPQPFQTFTHNSFLRFRLTSCCPTVPDPSFFPAYQVNFYMMTNNENCYDDGQFVFPNNCGGNLLDCANAANNVESCTDCLWLPLTGVTEDFNLHCPGCNSPGMIITNYEMKRSTFGFEDFNDTRIADNTGTNPISIDTGYARYDFLNHHGSNFGDNLADTLSAWFFDGPTFVSGNDPDTSGFSYNNNMISGSNNLVLRYLQLNRLIPHMNTMNIKLKSFKLYIDAELNNPALECCDCEEFYTPQQILDGRQTIFMLERIGDIEMAPYVQRIVNGEDGNYFFTFDADELAATPSGFVDCASAGNFFNGYFADQTFRLVCEYEVCGNFLPGATPPTLLNTRRQSEIENQMWLSGIEHDYTAFANFPVKPDYVNDVLLYPEDSTIYGELDINTGELIFDESFIEDFIFWCETYGGMHYFYSVYSLNYHPNPGNPTPETADDWCTKEFNSPSRLYIGHGNNFRYEFKIPPLDLNHLRLSVPANWEVERILYTTRNFGQDNFVEIDFNTVFGTPTLTSGVHLINANNSGFGFPTLIALDDINTNDGTIQVFGDEQLLQMFRFRMKPADCVSRNVVNISNCFLTSAFDNTEIFSDTTSCALISMTDTTQCRVMVTGNLNPYHFGSMPLRSPNPNLTLNVSPSLQIADANEVCWDVSFYNQNISTQTTSAPFVFIEVPQSSYLDNNSWYIDSNGDLNYPIDGFFQIAENMDNTQNNVVVYSGQLCATMNQCLEDTLDVESINLIFGWNCGNFPPGGMFFDVIGLDTIANICNSDTLELSLGGAVSAAILQGTYGPVSGCSDLVVEYTLTSIDNGFIYPSGFTVSSLPPGLTISTINIFNNAGYIDLAITGSMPFWDFVSTDIFGLQGNVPGFGNQEVTIEIHFTTDCDYNGEIPLLTIFYVNYCQEFSELSFPPSGTSLFTTVNYDNCSPPCNLCDEFQIDAQQTGCTFDFSAQEPYFQGCGNSSIIWDFGDGNSATGNFVQHVYSNPGNYNVTASFSCIFDGDTIYCETDYPVSCDPCEGVAVSLNTDNCNSNFEVTVPSVCENTIVIIQYGDGNTDGGLNVFNFSHTYAQSGSYQLGVITHCFTADSVFVNTCILEETVFVECDSIKEPMDDFCFFINNSGYLDEVTALTKKGTSSIALTGTMHQDFYNADKYLAILSPADLLSEWQSPGSATPAPAGRIGESSASTIDYADVGKSVLVKGRYMYTLGETSEPGTFWSRLLVTCYDWTSQTFMWSQTYNALGIDQGVKILDMDPEQDRILIIGNTRLWNSGTWDIFAIAIDENGNLISSRIYSPFGDMDQEEFASDAMRISSDNFYAIVGTRYWNSDSDMLAFKIDFDLNPISDMHLIGSGYREVANGVAQVGSRLYLVGNIDKYNDADQVYLVELSATNMAPTGVNAIYVSEFGRLVANKIITDSDRNLIISGFLAFGEEVSQLGLALKVQCAPALTSHLDIIWSSITNMDYSAYFNTVMPYSSTHAILGGAIELGPGDTDLFLVQIETSRGEACCLKPISLDRKAEFKSSKLEMSKDTLHVKVGKYGVYTPDFYSKFICPEVGDPEIEHPVKSIMAAMSFSVFPNPNRGFFTVRLNDASDRIRSIQMFDVSGRIIEHISFNANDRGSNYLDVDGRHLNSGVYLLKVESDMGSRTTRISVFN